MTIPTTEKLAKALEESGAPTHMITKAREGFYDDFKSELVAPCVQLVADLEALGFNDLADRAKNGEFDATPEESEAWTNSPEGQEAFSSLTKRFF